MPTYDCGRGPAVAVGPASVDRPAAVCEAFGTKSAVVVADPAVVASGFVARVTAMYANNCRPHDWTEHG